MRKGSIPLDELALIILSSLCNYLFGSTLCLLTLYLAISPTFALHHSSPPFSFNFPFLLFPRSSIDSILLDIHANGACVSPFDPCPVIIQYARVTRRVITGFCQSSLSHCWRFTIELENRGNRRSYTRFYFYFYFYFILFFMDRRNVIKSVRNIYVFVLWFYFFFFLIVVFLKFKFWSVLILIMILRPKVYRIVRERECNFNF